ncbi:hypothetical protein DQA11_24950, partial [Escherichia coli]|nr:hypothetical protein [Escherichia coli]
IQRTHHETKAEMNCAPRYLLLTSFQMNCFYLYHDNINVREYINHVSVRVQSNINSTVTP